MEEIEIKNLLVFDEDEMAIDYRKKRATSAKHNTNVILPGPLTAAQEHARRVVWGEIIEEFTDEAGD